MVLQVDRCDPQVRFEDEAHGDVVLAGLTKLRDMEKLFDVVLCVENDRLPAHRVVLASCSDYFRAMFTDGLLECQLDEITLNGMSAKGMRALIDFAYSSKIDIDLDNVQHVLCAANHIQLLPVVEACVDFLQSHVSTENCVDMLNIAELFTLHDLSTFLYKFISENFLAFGMSAEFYALSTSQLETLLDLNYPVNCTECDVLSAVIGWIVHHQGYNSDKAGKFLGKIHVESLSWDDIKTMANFSVLEKLIAENISDSLIQHFLKSVQNTVHNVVPGLVNLRGYDESVVICGGFKPGQGMTNSVQYYNKSTGTLQYLTSVPHVEQCNFGLSVVNNKLYIVGGCYNDDHMEEIVHSFGFCYDPMKNTWQNIFPMKMERCRFYLGAVGNKLYAIGGDPSASMETGDFAHCESYDIETRHWQDIAPLPGNRMEHAGTVVGESLYVSGGLQDTEGPVFNTFFKFDTNINMWSQLPSMPTARADHNMLTYGGKIYAIGGWYEDATTHQRVMANTVDCFDLDKGQWEVIARVPAPRLYATYTAHQGQIVVIGGWLNGNCQRKSSSVEIFDLDTLTWSEVKRSVNSEKHSSPEVWEHASCSLYIPNHHNVLKPN